MSFEDVLEQNVLQRIQVLPVTWIPISLGQYYVILFLRKQKHLLLCVRLCAGFQDIKVSVVRQGPCLKERIFNT